MSSNFVRYSPEIETIDPDLDEYMTRIIDFWEKTVRESPVREGTGHAVRGAHAKTLGVVKAEVEILGDAPAPHAQGIYAKPGHHGALIRFFSASNHLGPDALLGPVLGFAIKIFDIDGTKLVDDEPDSSTFDLVLKNTPTFVANMARQDGVPRALDRSPHRQGHVRAVVDNRCSPDPLDAEADERHGRRTMQVDDRGCRLSR